MTTTRHASRPSQRTRDGRLWLLYLTDAGLLLASGLIHLHLWDIAYRHVKTLDVLMAGTIIGFVLVRTVGLFGFHLTFISTEAYGHWPDLSPCGPEMRD
jgi:hypothetical protein